MLVISTLTYRMIPQYTISKNIYQSQTIGKTQQLAGRESTIMLT